jgi:hypothetical protein
VGYYAETQAIMHAVCSSMEQEAGKRDVSYFVSKHSCSWRRAGLSKQVSK